MKLSRFNVWASYDQGLILFNIFTGALATFDQIYTKILLSAFEKYDAASVPIEFLSGMIEDGYLVEDNYDELQVIADACAERQTRTDECFLCVILTMDCNFRCFYCFENRRKESLAVVGTNRILNMFQSLTGRVKKIEVDWSGGETLLSLKVLREMNDRFMVIAQSFNVEYKHSITTNGYLLNQKIIEYLRTTPLSLLTVTLDGPPKTHDACRPFKDDHPTFWIIFRNIEKAVVAGIKVSLRVNVTTRNMGEIHVLYNILENHDLKNKVEVNLQPVVSSPANPCQEYCLSGYELANRVMSIYKEAAKNGWIVLPPTEKMRALGFCVGEYPNRFIIDLRGNLYRCGQMLESDTVGKIVDNGFIKLEPKKNNLWVKKNPLEFADCRECALLPICMGGCNMKRFLGGGTGYCLNWKHDLPGFLEVLVLNEENIHLAQEDSS